MAATTFLKNTLEHPKTLSLVCVLLHIGACVYIVCVCLDQLKSLV